jgi:hypothetical protein
MLILHVRIQVHVYGCFGNEYMFMINFERYKIKYLKKEIMKYQIE